MVSKLIRSGMVAALALAGVITTAGPAQAADPSCIQLSWWSTATRDYARAVNYCSGPRRLKFIWAYAFDGECTYYAVNQGRTEWRGKQARFERVVNC
jgi:hypothetical protein